MCLLEQTAQEAAYLNTPPGLQYNDYIYYTIHINVAATVITKKPA